MKQKIAIIGFGTVGQGLAEILSGKKDELLKKYGYKFSVVAVSDMRFGAVYDPDGLDINALLADIRQNGQFTKNAIDWDAGATIRNCNANVVCELTYTNLQNGQPAISHCETAFETGKHVVTSNKGPAALAYGRLKKLAAKHNVMFLIEGTVMSGTPVLNLTSGPLAGCDITAVKGILNGTTNYILTRMENGMTYNDALAKAQELGYAEADPTGDVEGFDARAKVTILANIVMGEPLAINDVVCEGITRITSEDILAAKNENVRWKLIGGVEMNEGSLSAYVRPEKVPMSHPLAGINGAMNAVTFQTDLLGDVTIVGPGAGRRETGFSILTDLLTIHSRS